MDSTHGIHVHQRHTRETSSQCNKLVQIITSTPTDDGSHYDKAESENVLLPFDLVAVFARFDKQTILNDTNGREQLERC